METTRSSILVLLFVLLHTVEFSSSIGYFNEGVTESERQALLKFKNSLTDPSNRLSSWVGEDYCSWKGVGCNQKTGHVVKLNLRNLYLFHFDDWDDSSNYSKSCLGGEINPSLLELKYLNFLDLSMNNFNGMRIPKFIGSLEKLRYLNLSNAGLDGMVPHHLGNLSRLQYLDLSRHGMGYQNLTSDNLKWVSHLSSLRYLDLSHMYIGEGTDWLHAINMIPSLSELYLYYCGLQDIPSLLYVNFTSLAILDLRWNRINSTIPLWLFNLSSLVYLNLAVNHFHGPIPDAIGNLTSLTNLYLNDNKFHGEIPMTLRNLCNLQILFLEENKFSGEISIIFETGPHWLFNLSSFTQLNLANNIFHGSIPDSIGNMTFLTDLNLNDNEFEGEIPRTLRYLCNLRNLYLQGNKFRGEISIIFESLSGCVGDNLENLILGYNEFHGEIPESLGQLSKLEFLDMSNILLEGTLSELHFAKLRSLEWLSMSSKSLVLNVSSTWIPPFQLTYLVMRSVKLGPQFPPWLKTQKNISFLVMSNTSISDTIPDWFQDLFMLIYTLDLSHNQIRGRIQQFLKLGSPSVMEQLDLSYNLLLEHIPSDFGDTAPELSELHLSGNHLNGSIPMSLCQMENLQVLDLSENHLSGQLPHCWKDSMSLYWIDFSYNNLSGHIPSSMGSLHLIKSLYLNNNNFNGQLPSTLKNCTSLIILDLSENGFYGKISPWIGQSFYLLEFFSLRANKIDGNIPPQLCHLDHLRLLDLSHNNISGTIPGCFGNFSSMKWKGEIETKNLSTDKEHMLVIMKGRELEYTGNLPFVISLDLSSNNMVGGIPKELTDLHGLRSLNISGNHLTGRIPEKIGDLTLLESLDFSRNQLVGPIPPSMSSLTFLSHLNLSFNNLSGPIPMGNQLQTLNDPSIYTDNPELCGYPLQKSCTGDDLSDVPMPIGGGKSEDDSRDDNDMQWFSVGVGPGFACGFLAIWGVLLIKKTWRYAYFQLLENIYNRLLEAVAINAAWLKRLHRDKVGA